MADIEARKTVTDPATRELVNISEIYHDNGDGTHSKKVYVTNPNYATKITVVGTVTYVALAVPGTAQSSASWQVKKIDETTGTVITWADGNANFDNVATDLTTLTYA